MTNVYLALVMFAVLSVFLAVAAAEAVWHETSQRRADKRQSK